MRQPLIGITTATRPTKHGWPFLVAYAKNVEAIERAGGLPIMIPCNLATDTLRALYERIDGILLPGGGDIDPTNYDAERHPKTDFTDLDRDKTEIALARWSAEDDRPLFGICRGHQLVNVALGGTLLQDIPELYKTEFDHFPSSDEYPRDYIPHHVRVEPDSVLHRIVGDQTINVNSLHHQAIEQIAPALRVTAYAPDGMIEAAEIPDKYFYHTVQWHPEDLTANPQMQALFDALVEAAQNKLR